MTVAASTWHTKPSNTNLSSRLKKLSKLSDAEACCGRLTATLTFTLFALPGSARVHFFLEVYRRVSAGEDCMARVTGSAYRVCGRACPVVWVWP